MSKSIYDVLALLRNVEGPDGSGNYKACCPAHDDKKQSLSIKQGDKGVVLKCFAGCGTRQIPPLLSKILGAYHGAAGGERGQDGEH